MNNFHISEISFSFQDFPDSDPEGALVVYISGCTHKCIDCHNPQLIDPIYGKAYSIEELEEILLIEAKRYNFCKRVVLMGGDPFFLSNRNLTLEFLQITSFNVGIYTGCTKEELKELEIWDKLRGNIEFIKCGRFDKTKYVRPEKADSYFQLASKNQEIYNRKLELISKYGRIEFEEYI